MTAPRHDEPLVISTPVDAPAQLLSAVLGGERPVWFGDPAAAAAVLGVATDAEVLALTSRLLPAGVHLHAFARPLSDERLVRLWDERWGCELEAALRFEALRRGLYDVVRAGRDIERAASVPTWHRDPIEAMFRFPAGAEHGWTSAEVLQAVEASHAHVGLFRDALRAFHERKRQAPGALEMGGLFTFALVANDEWCRWLANIARGPSAPRDLGERLATVLYGRSDAEHVLDTLRESGLPQQAVLQGRAHLRWLGNSMRTTASVAEPQGIALGRDDVAWAGPFDTHQAIEDELGAALRDAGLQRDDESGTLVSVLLACVGGRWWAQVPAPLARGQHTFFIELAYDAEDEWGPPIGYDVYAVIQRDAGAWRGDLVRSVREETHPDNGEIDGGIAEASRRSAAPFEREDRLEFGILDW